MIGASVGWTEKKTDSQTMQYIEKSWWGRVRLARHESGDLGPAVTQTKQPDLFKALKQIAETEGKIKRV